MPIPFELDFAPERIEPNSRYAVRAEIREVSGELMFTTTTNHAVLGPGAVNEGIEILVQRATDRGAGGGPRENGGGLAQSTGSLTGETWRLVAITRAGAAPEPVPPEPTYTIEFRADARARQDGVRVGRTLRGRRYGLLEPRMVTELGAIESSLRMAVP